MFEKLIIRLLRLFFFFNDTATTEIYTLSLHDALPIDGADEDVLQEIRNLRVPPQHGLESAVNRRGVPPIEDSRGARMPGAQRLDQALVSTSESQWRHHLFCRLRHDPPSPVQCPRKGHSGSVFPRPPASSRRG